MIKIANFVTDEKFIDAMIERHDYIECDVFHDYFIVLDDIDYEFKLIKKFKDRVRCVSRDEINQLLLNEGFDAVLLHNLYSMPLEIIANIPSCIIVFWMVWGFDVYNVPRIPLIKVRLFKKLTKRFIIQQNVLKYLKDTVSARLKGFGIDLHKKQDDLYKKAVHRVDYFSGVLPNEFELAKKCHFFRANEFKYSYSTVNQMTNAEQNTNVEEIGNNIMLGNSAMPVNNHLDILELLKKNKIQNRIVYAPLSYGGEKKYVEKIIKKAHSILGIKFIPILDFMSPTDYFKIFKTCGYCIYGVVRQQAVQNVEYALKNGLKVFLPKDSINYKYYKSIGVKIFNIEENLTLQELSIPLSIDERRLNNTIISNLYTLDSETNKMRYILRIIEDHN